MMDLLVKMLHQNNQEEELIEELIILKIIETQF